MFLISFPLIDWQPELDRDAERDEAANFYAYTRLLNHLPPDQQDALEFALTERVVEHGADTVCQALDADELTVCGSRDADDWTPEHRSDVRSLYDGLRSSSRYLARIADREDEYDPATLTYIAYRSAVSLLFPVSRESIEKFLSHK